MRQKRDAQAFTLVELLVVIGIIAVLISMLLPSLNKARQQAALIECQSNLKQIGTLLAIYSSENKGYLPYGWGPYSTSLRQPAWNWTDTLSLIASKRAAGDYVNVPGSPYYNDLPMAVQSMAYDFPAIFHDPESGNLPYGVRACEFTANARVLPDGGGHSLQSSNIQDYMAAPQHQISPIAGITTGYLPMALRQMSSITRSSEVMMIWCSSPIVDSGAITSADSLDVNIDDSEIYFGMHDHSYPTPAASWYVGYNNPISLGLPAAVDSVTGAWDSSGPPTNVVAHLQLENVDGGGSVNAAYNATPGYNPYCDMRFRHLGNKAVNALFVDGHVEMRLIGSVIAKDICLNPVPTHYIKNWPTHP